MDRRASVGGRLLMCAWLVADEVVPLSQRAVSAGPGLGGLGGSQVVARGLPGRNRLGAFGALQVGTGESLSVTCHAHSNAASVIVQ